MSRTEPQAGRLVFGSLLKLVVIGSTIASMILFFVFGLLFYVRGDFAAPEFAKDISPLLRTILFPFAGALWGLCFGGFFGLMGELGLRLYYRLKPSSAPLVRAE